MKPEYLENHRRRTHHAIKAKRLLGEWVPNSGAINEADQILTKMRHKLINARAGWDTSPSDVQNFVTQLQRSRDISKTLEIYLRPSASHRRRTMTARRIAHRLGLLEERADDVEKHLWSRDALKNWRWFTTKRIPIPHLNLKLEPGTEVYYGDNGGFSVTEEFSISAEQARHAGVTRRRRFTADGRRIRYHGDNR